jgi:hypothetical protein
MEKIDLLGYNVVYFVNIQPTFRASVFMFEEQSKQEINADCLLPVSLWFPDSLILP